MAPSCDCRFDGWTLCRRSGELFRGDRRIRLQSQPLQILEELLANPGELVTREQLIARLWPQGIVDFDTALNSAVRRLRRALGDSAEAPRYIETVPRRGYRFIGRLDAPNAPVQPGEDLADLPAKPRARRGVGWVAAAAAVLGVAVAAALYARWFDGVGRAHELPAPAASELALEPYLRARHFLQRRGPEDLDLARQYFAEALAADPGLARAWAGLADVNWLDTVEQRLPAEQGLEMVRNAAERALALDPSLAEPHLRLSNYWSLAGNEQKRDEHFAKARSLEPHNPLVLSYAASQAASEGRFDEAIELQWHSVAADPLSLASRWNLAAWLYLAGRLPESEAELLRLRELNPAHRNLAARLAKLLVLEGRFDEALELTGEMTDEADRLCTRALALHGLGRQSESDAALHALIQVSRGEQRLCIAESYAQRGQAALALASLHELVDSVENYAWFQYSPFLRALRAHPGWDDWLNAARRRHATSRDSRRVG